MSLVGVPVSKQKTGRAKTMFNVTDATLAGENAQLKHELNSKNNEENKKILYLQNEVDTLKERDSYYQTFVEQFDEMLALDGDGIASVCADLSLEVKKNAPQREMLQQIFNNMRQKLVPFSFDEQEEN